MFTIENQNFDITIGTPTTRPICIVFVYTKYMNFLVVKKKSWL